MLGVRKVENKESGRSLQKFEGITRKIPIDMKFTMSEGEPTALEVICPERDVSAQMSGDVPEIAHTRPLDKDSVRKNLVKLGATSFSAREVEVEINGSLIMPLSAINALRREAVELLAQRLSSAEKSRSSEDFKDISDNGESLDKSEKPSVTAEFFTADAISPSAREFFDIIYLPLDKYDGSVAGVSMPAVVFDSELPEVERMLRRAKELGARYILVQNVAQLSLARKYGFEIYAGMRMNACNKNTVVELLRFGAEQVLLSPELTLAQLRDMPSRASVCVYGRIPLMITEKCVSGEISDCKTCESGCVALTDRKGVKFPVLKAYGHRSEIYNSVPIYMADRMQTLPKHLGRHFVFSTERASEVEEVVYRYKNGIPAEDKLPIRRIK